MIHDTDFCIFRRMKTTLDLRDDLLARAKALAAAERTTLTKVVEEGLALRIRRRKTRVRGELKELPVSIHRGGLRCGLDGASNQSLLDAADQRRPT